MKKYRSNWFRVAIEGATSDKRTIKRSWLEQAAKNFNPSTYGARIWLEHFRSLLPDSPFKAYGDVLAVKAEEVDVNGQKKLALFAKVEPTNDLIAMNKAKQKIYTSVEIDESFADTGEAYIVGLAVTDSPASLGTDVLAFSAQKPESSPFQDRHYSETSMFTEAVETELKFEEFEEKPSIGAQLFTKVQTLLTGKQAKDDREFIQIGEAVEAIAEHVKDLPDQLAAEKQFSKGLQTRLDQVSTELTELKNQLSTTQDPNQKMRPQVSGGGNQVMTDC
ncbi:Phage capsid scaffolding protein (GPO) serine peptidase [Pseudomonas sp. NFIX10]|uniref:GPO family capsid scaffolding protein n=1 Tax=unclassified Pseudomonas TaxID=196821 RepID=UPI0008F2E369|nr:MULTISPECIES: GPO family capsid scaffolding protein [unclassified Pseudomonas]SFB45502.1 Phage capsid scaffolding protein (GPO) serine peptidase [Pseudomonas sp. NFIX10]SFF16729.1 Phage capsid scaffolding protein (GPO) serine peptidase [Pseudomonas sp. NFACC06-1]